MTNLRLIVGIVGVIILGMGMIYLALSDRDAYFKRLDDLVPDRQEQAKEPDGQGKPSMDQIEEDQDVI